MSQKIYRSGFSLTTVVGIIFVLLKLIGVQPIASWSWWWVTCPFWIGLVSGLLLIGMFIVLGVVCAMFGSSGTRY